MALRVALPAALVTVASLGCAKASAPPPTASPAPEAATAAVPQRADMTRVVALDKTKFGAPITETTSTPLDDLMKSPGTFAAKTVRTEGRVSAVCQHMGCWMEIADDAGKAHVKMAGHKFFVPRSAAGHHAVIQGKVLASDKDHCTEEAEEQTGEVAKVQIEATGVEFVD
ncbi:MAG TPA: DUF4920 domain-containing protein [Minicystis sp.]|nr:DUF4920 domain-containing protein [Minicystis sp.]